MPVVKNDWDIYKSSRARKTSECNTSCTGRTRKISECGSEGPVLVSSSKVKVPMAKHHSVPDRMPSRAFSRPRTSSEHLPNRAKVSAEKSVSASTSNMKQANPGGGWLDKLRNLMKNKKQAEEERSK